MSDIYRDIVLDHWRNPRHAEPIENATNQSTVLNEQCGDQAAVQLNVRDGKIESVSVQVDGCALATASGSVLAEHLVGEPTEKIQAITAEDIRHWLGDMAEVTARTNCITLALITAQRAIK